MPTTWITYHGVDVQIRYRDHGYEPDTNAHEIDWWFVDQELNDQVKSDEDTKEMDLIDQRIRELAAERPTYYDD